MVVSEVLEKLLKRRLLLEYLSFTSQARASGKTRSDKLASKQTMYEKHLPSL
jgi:hypothetical protein